MIKSKAQPKIDLLLAVYNGQDYIQDLIESLFLQSYKANILIRDDESTDFTPDIISSYSDRICFINDNIGNSGVIQNFNALLSASKADYLAFADQDDVWESDKLDVQMDLMLRMEQEFGPKTPILVHSDLAVCDAQMRIIAPSLWRYQRLNPTVRNFSRLLVQNNITGCTVVINKALKDRAFPVPQEAVVHDWWLALVASAVGRIGYVSRPLVRYRQHGGNQLGAVRSDLRGVIKRVRFVDPQMSLRASRLQAQAFSDRYDGQRDMSNALKLANAYATIEMKRYPARLVALCKYGFWKQDFLRNAGLIMAI